jgi:hypothetical protein
MLAECRAIITNIFLQPFVSDSWQWHPDPVGGYSVRSGYAIITSHEYQLRDDAQSLV